MLTANIESLDIIHLKLNVSDIGLCLRPQVKAYSAATNSFPFVLQLFGEDVCDDGCKNEPISFAISLCRNVIVLEAPNC